MMTNLSMLFAVPTSGISSILRRIIPTPASSVWSRTIVPPKTFWMPRGALSTTIGSGRRRNFGQKMILVNLSPAMRQWTKTTRRVTSGHKLRIGTPRAWITKTLPSFIGPMPNPEFLRKHSELQTFPIRLSAGSASMIEWKSKISLPISV